MRWLGILAGMMLASGSVAAEPQPAGCEVIHPFDYRGVRLEDGPLMDQLRETRTAYMRVSNDSYLKGFRRRAGRPAPGEELGGWYGQDFFHVFGQVVSGLARLYAATGDQAVKQKVDDLVSGWGECLEPDGYFFYSRNPNSPHYIYEKTVCGLIDAHLYAATPRALEYLDRITTWAENNLERDRSFALSAVSKTGSAQEWYTLSENLYRAYLITGQERYRDFARIWEYPEYWDTFRLNRDILKRRGEYHAYSHVNTFSGAAMAYRVTGSPDYLQTIVHAYDYLRVHQNYATGGYGPGERLLPQKKLIASLQEENRSFETQCGTWAGFKLSKYLIAFTGEGRFGDWTELLLINGISASLPMSPDGLVTYYSHYAMDGAFKANTVSRWPCCAGTRIQAVADFADLIYFHSDQALYVNLFTPSTGQWTCRGTQVRVRQQTRFPEESTVRLTISTADPVEFALKLRNPAWLASPMRLRINGAATAAPIDARGWVSIQRTWRDGDVLEVELPMALKAIPFPAASDAVFPTAIAYGPTVLAFASPQGPPGKLIDFADLAGCLKPDAEGGPLAFSIAGHPEIVARPLYAYPEAARYYLYIDPSYSWRTVPVEQLHLTGEWRRGGLLVTREVGAALECEFQGTSVRWMGEYYDDAGRSEVFIDDKPVALVDQYDRQRGRAFKYVLSGLTPGRHRLRIVLREESNPKSRDRYLNVRAIACEP